MKRNIFITVCIGLGVSIGIFFSQGENQSIEESGSNKLAKAQRIDEALEWRKELLADPATGEFDVNLLYTALAKADELKSQANKSGVLGLNWELVGPDNQGGRTRALIFDRIVPNKLWAGSVGGGLFKSLDGGNNWTRVVTYDGFS